MSKAELFQNIQKILFNSKGVINALRFLLNESILNKLFIEGKYSSDNCILLIIVYFSIY